MEILVPITLFLCIFGAFALYRYFKLRGQVEVQRTLRQALESGQTLSAETIEAMLPGTDGPEVDRRRGVIALALALAIVTFALVLGEDDAIGPLLGIATFPLFLSFGYLWLARGARNA
ncbi:MAG: DUF6249 domain-containing protein [Pseudomonadota bacterium]